MAQETQKRIPYIYAGLAGLVVLLGIVLFLIGTEPHQEDLWEPATSVEEAYQAYAYQPDPNSSLIRFTPGVESWYVHEDLKFSFRLPEGFTAPDGKLKDSNAWLVVLSNASGNELHIAVEPVSADIPETISETFIRSQEGGEQAFGFEAVALPKTVGISFKTKSDAGEVLHTWFVRDGYMYMLSTRQQDAELMDLVLGTWRFALPVPPLGSNDSLKR